MLSGAAIVKEEAMVPPMPPGTFVKEEDLSVPPMPLGAFVKEEGEVPPMPFGAFVKHEPLVDEDVCSDDRSKRQRSD